MMQKYIVRLQLVKLPPHGRPEVLVQNSAEYDDEHGAIECFKDCMREMPQTPEPVRK